MIKKNQTIKGITFANLSYGAESHVQLGDIKLTLPQSEIYLHANEYKSAVFIGGRGAGKSFLADIFLEESLAAGNYRIISVLCSGNITEHHKNLQIKHYSHYTVSDVSPKHLSGLDTSKSILHLEEPFSARYFNTNWFRFEHFYVECTVPQLDKNKALDRWFIDLVGLDSTLTVIAPTHTNQHNLGMSQYSTTIYNCLINEPNSDFDGI